jgi:hypothetical protein
MFRYDANTGGFPQLGDRVKICHTGSDMDGLTGRIGGWGDQNKLIALVILDKPYENYICRCDTDQVEVVGMPVVCLKKTVSKEVEQKWAPFVEPDWHPTKNPFGNLCSESVAIDADGFIVWEGGANRPVSDTTIVQVKVRSGVRRDPIDALYWPQICWQHREPDDPMNKWDIVAYKVIK